LLPLILTLQIEVDPSLVVLTPSLASALLTLLRSLLATSLIDAKDQFFYGQLKIVTMKSIGTLLKNQSSFMAFVKEGGMDTMMEIATKPQPALGYSDFDSAQDRETIPRKFWEIIEQSQDPVSFYHNPSLAHHFLPHFPFMVTLSHTVTNHGNRAI
jgi:hypothetical protein